MLFDVAKGVVTGCKLLLLSVHKYVKSQLVQLIFTFIPTEFFKELWMSSAWHMCRSQAVWPFAIDQLQKKKIVCRFSKCNPRFVGSKILNPNFYPYP